MAMEIGPTNIVDSTFDYSILSHADNWSNNCLCPMNIVNATVQTSLIVNDPDLTYRLDTSNFEVYSAGMLRFNKHSRTTYRPEKIQSINASTLVIPRKQHTHIDKSKDVLHVYRLGSPTLRPHLKNLKFNISLVARTVMKYGELDCNRKKKVGRILNFGVNADYMSRISPKIEVKVRLK